METLDFHVGDDCYVLGQGKGRITKVLQDNGGYVVAIPARGENIFSRDGRVGSGIDQRLFYSNPIFMHPPKDSAFWEAYKAVAIKLYEVMKGAWR
jgi:hypothetical protein